MSVVGPRPALWNQDDLIAEQASGVNALVPSLTGWAQANGRDELPIPEAELDGYYAEPQLCAGCENTVQNSTRRLKGDGVVGGSTHGV